MSGQRQNLKAGWSLLAGALGYSCRLGLLQVAAPQNYPLVVAELSGSIYC